MLSTRPSLPPIIRIASVLLLFASSSVDAQGEALDVTCVKTESEVIVSVDRRPFTRYVFGGRNRPCLWPVTSADGVEVTRRWPLAEPGPGERKDHPHHTGIWFGHGNVNGIDFWHPQDKKRGGRIVVTEWLDDPATSGRVHVRHAWRGPDGKELARDVTTIAFGGDTKSRWIDWCVEIEATEQALEFRDTKEGTFGMRMHPALRLEGAVATGNVITSTGKTGKAVWGKRAAWIDYHGKVPRKDGTSRTVGVAMMDHPHNPRHPTWWHARAYGLCSANPFGTRAFEGKAASRGDFVIPKGDKKSFRWRVLVHDGDTRSAKIDLRYRSWATATPNDRNK